jgi:FMN phosphatase YigB (HAD superfamily)/DNA-binding XRE family transcriptional regulator
MDEVGLGRQLQAYRQRAGLTQQELCQRAEISYSTLAKIERGAIKAPSVFTIQKIALAIGATLDDLMGGLGAQTSPAPVKLKKTSKSGISFLYLDINGCLVRFFHEAFNRLAVNTGASPDLIETTFWHYNDAVCRGEMTLEQFDETLSNTLGKKVSWKDYYMQTIDPIEETASLLKWASEHYKIGLLSNIMPGFINEMISRGLLPKLQYDVIVDSSEVGSIKPEESIYEVASKKAGVPSSEILFVDDSRTNLMAAERLGWRVLWFDDYRPAESARRIKDALEF